MCLLRYRHRVMVLMHDDTAWFCAQYHKKRVKTKNCIGKQHHTLNETNEKKNETYKEQATAIHTSAKHENSFMSVIAHWIHDDDDEKWKNKLNTSISNFNALFLMLKSYMLLSSSSLRNFEHFLELLKLLLTIIINKAHEILDAMQKEMKPSNQWVPGIISNWRHMQNSLASHE